MAIIKDGRAVEVSDPSRVMSAFGQYNRALLKIDTIFGIHPDHYDLPFVDYSEYWWGHSIVGDRWASVSWGQTPVEINSPMCPDYVISNTPGHGVYFSGHFVLVFIADFYDGTGALVLLDMNKCAFTRTGG